jgi:hypothetical protein
VLFRAVDIGAELFAMSAACSRAQMLSKQGRPEAITLADAFCIEARDRIKLHFDQLFGPNDGQLYKLAMQVLGGEHAWLEQGIVSMVAGMETTKPRAPAGSAPLTPRAAAPAGATQ